MVKNVIHLYFFNKKDFSLRINYKCINKILIEKLNKKKKICSLMEKKIVNKIINKDIENIK